MKGYRFCIAPLLLALFVLAPRISMAACDQTLSLGAGLASAISNASTGTTICLNSGNWGTVDLFNINRGGYVTVKSASSRGATITPRVGNSRYIRFESLTVSGLLQNSCSTHIQWVNNTFVDMSAVTNSGCSNLDTIFDGNTFNNINVGPNSYEGRLSIVYGCPSGITVRNNTFSGGISDGIQVLGGACNVQIGPGNVFQNILEANCGAVHCDAIQLYGAGANVNIEGNWFKNGDTFIMAPDGSDNLLVKNNVFDGTGVAYPFKLQFGTASSLTFQHNTLKDASVAIDSKTGTPASTNANVQNNVHVGASSYKTTGGSGCSNCVFANNLFDNSGDALGSTNVIGAPTFSGGSSPATWAGWRMANGSLGKSAGSDGLDMGATYFGPGTGAGGGSSTLVAPTNLRVQ
jgi:hypothetical protein